MHISKLVLICCSLLLLLSRSRIYNTTSYLHEQQSKIDFPSLPPCNRGFTKPNVKGPPIVWTLYNHTNDLVREGGTNTALSLHSQYSMKLTLNLVPHSHYKHFNSTQITKPSHYIATCHHHIGWDPVESHAHRFMEKERPHPNPHCGRESRNLFLLGLTRKENTLSREREWIL